MGCSGWSGCTNNLAECKWDAVCQAALTHGNPPPRRGKLNASAARLTRATIP